MQLRLPGSYRNAHNTGPERPRASTNKAPATSPSATIFTAASSASELGDQSG